MSANTVVSERPNTGKGEQTAYPRWQFWLFWGIIGALVLIAIVMRLYQLGVPFDRDGYDEGVYWQSLRAMSAGNQLYGQIFYSQPPFFLLSTYPFYALFGSSLWSARFGIALVSLLGIPGAYMLGKSLGRHAGGYVGEYAGGRVGGWMGAVLAIVLVLVNPIYLMQSQTIQAEVSSAAFALLSVGAAYLWWDNPESGRGLYYAALCGVTVSLGILCKLLDFSCLAPIVLLMLARLWQVKQGQEDATRRSVRAISVGVIGFIVVLAILTIPFLGVWQQMIAGVVTFHTRAGQIMGQQASILALKQQYFKTFLTSQFALCLAAGLGTVVALLRRNWKVIPLLAWLIVSLLLLWITTPLFYRHLIALVPPLIALSIMGLEGLPVPTLVGTDLARPPSPATQIATNTVPALAVLLILIAAGVNARQDVTYYHAAAQQSANGYTQLEARVANDLRDSIAPDQLVVTDAQFVAALADRSTPPSLVDSSMVRIDSGYLTLQQLEDATAQPNVHAVLFFTGRLTLPALAPFHTWVTQHFHLKYRYGPGEELWVR